MAEFHERLQEAMRLKDIKPVDLCEKTSIPKSAMSQYIAGKFKPKQTRTFLIAKALDVSDGWLMGLDVPMERPSEDHRKKAASFDTEYEAAIKKIQSLNEKQKKEVYNFINFVKSQSDNQ